jgi:peptidylprolyl isomerase
MKPALMFTAHLVVIATLAATAATASKHPATVPTSAAPGEADWRTPDAANVLVIDTTKGRVIVELTPQVAPKSAAQVRELARAGFYDGRAFFRVIEGFMDQTGDPTDTGQGGSTRPNLPGEFTFRRDATTPLTVADKQDGREAGFIGAMPVISQSLDLASLTADHKVSASATYCPGVVGMARTEDPDSGNSQFFLMRGAQTSLDQKYTAVGRVIAGMDVVRAIKTGEPVAAPQDKMLTVRVLADMPAAQRPGVRVIDPRSAWFTAMTARVRAEKLIGLSMCDLDLPSQVK